MTSSSLVAQSSPFVSTRLGLWLPQPADSLVQTLCKVYGLGSTDPMLFGLVQLHLKLNPGLYSEHAPMEKKVIYLADLHANKGVRMDAGMQAATLAVLNAQKAQLAASKQKLESIVPSNPEQVEAMRFVLGFDEVMGHVGTGAGIGVNSLSTLTGRHLQADMLEFNRWANEKASLVKAGKGKDILHHYDARMDELVKRIQNRLGPTERFLFNNGTKDALFSGTPKSLRPGAITIGAAERVAQMATKAKVAGAALVVLDAALTCHKLANTAEGQKVETAYREIGGFGTSLLVGLGVGVAVASMATPVGWLGAVIISAGTAYGSKAIGEAVGEWRFKEKGDFLNLKDGKILNSWCK